MSLDIERLEQTLVTVREEVLALRAETAARAELEREAALQELYEALCPAARALAKLVAASPRKASPEAELAEALAEAFQRVGLEKRGTVGDELELWPEQASTRLELDRDVPAEASLVRVEVLAPGWARGALVIARPLGRVIEVITP